MRFFDAFYAVRLPRIYEVLAIALRFFSLSRFFGGFIRICPDIICPDISKQRLRPRAAMLRYFVHAVRFFV